MSNNNNNDDWLSEEESTQFFGANSKPSPNTQQGQQNAAPPPPQPDPFGGGFIQPTPPPQQGQQNQPFCQQSPNQHPPHGQQPPGMGGVPGGNIGAAFNPQNSVAPLVGVSSQLNENPFLNAGASLLALLGNVRQAYQMEPDQIRALFNQLVYQINQFENQSKSNGCRPEHALIARYVMCSALDEAVLSTPWGSRSPWGQNTLLTTFHKEASGGEKFFLILQKMQSMPADNIEILELQYVILSLGFMGKYALSASGRQSLEDIRESVYRIISTYRTDIGATLSMKWKTNVDTNRSLVHYVPWWVGASVAGALLLFSYLGIQWWMRDSADEVLKNLNNHDGVAIEMHLDSQQTRTGAYS